MGGFVKGADKKGACAHSVVRGGVVRSITVLITLNVHLVLQRSLTDVVLQNVSSYRAGNDMKVSCKGKAISRALL